MRLTTLGLGRETAGPQQEAAPDSQVNKAERLESRAAGPTEAKDTSRAHAEQVYNRASATVKNTVKKIGTGFRNLFKRGIEGAGKLAKGAMVGTIEQGLNAGNAIAETGRDIRDTSKEAGENALLAYESAKGSVKETYRNTIDGAKDKMGRFQDRAKSLETAFFAKADGYMRAGEDKIAEIRNRRAENKWLQFKERAQRSAEQGNRVAEGLGISQRLSVIERGA